MKKRTVITTEKYETWVIHQLPVTAGRGTTSREADPVASDVRYLHRAPAEESESNPISSERDEGDSSEDTQTAAAGTMTLKRGAE
jgi:hypothetical protein